ncbi:MAG TPA: chemotaxis protein CheB [Polyangiales bacterium]|nr:chemotaxis protein CheB [Polyangiales bacterium]
MATTDIAAIAMGGSAGAFEALARILPALPAEFPLPIALVLHIPADKPSRVPAVLAAKCALRVKEAEDKEPLAPATLYVAAPGYHLLVERTRCLAFSVDEPVRFSRPSIDVLFESAADAYGPALVGVLLSGASEDGARGLACIKRAGGTAVVQSPESASSTAMPLAGLRSSAVDFTLPPERLGPWLAQLGSGAARRRDDAR